MYFNRHATNNEADMPMNAHGFRSIVLDFHHVFLPPKSALKFEPKVDLMPLVKQKNSQKIRYIISLRGIHLAGQVG